MKTRQYAVIFGLCVMMLGAQVAMAQGATTAGGGGGGARTGGRAGGGGVSPGGRGMTTAAAPTESAPDGEATSAAPTLRQGSISLPTVRAESVSSASRLPVHPPSADEGPGCVFDATVYTLKLPGDQIARIDTDELNKAAGKIDDFEKALAKYGKPKALYRANQSVKLEYDDIQIGAQMPYVSGSSMPRGGGGGMGGTGGMGGMGGSAVPAMGGATGRIANDPRRVNSVSYTSIGAQFHLEGSVENNKAIKLKLNIQLSVMSESTTTLSDAIKAPIFSNTTLVQNGPVEPNKPFVIMSIDSATRDADGAATAYIARINLGEPGK